jgi:predicted DNA-binding transcriptional regulator AlpA
VTVTSPVDAPSAESAAFALADTITETFPEAVVVRVDQDLVSIPDIAERTERSRESIRLLVEGKRGPGGFPSPVGIVGDGIRVWPWASVLDWFSRALGEELAEAQAVLPDVAAVVDACLATRRRHLEAC